MNAQIDIVIYQELGVASSKMSYSEGLNKKR